MNQPSINYQYGIRYMDSGSVNKNLYYYYIIEN